MYVEIFDDAANTSRRLSVTGVSISFSPIVAMGTVSVNSEAKRYFCCAGPAGRRPVSVGSGSRRLDDPGAGTGGIGATYGAGLGEGVGVSSSRKRTRRPC